MSDESKVAAQPMQDIPVEIDFSEIEQVSQVFFEESREIFKVLNPLILKIEENPSDQEQINVLFRKVHTLKGSVGAVPGGQLLGSLAHEFEALLNRIKRENRKVTKACIDIFLLSSRLLEVLGTSLCDKRELYPEELSEVIELITQYGSFQFEEEGVTPLFRDGRHRQEHRSAASSSESEGVWLSMKQFDEMMKVSSDLLALKNSYQMLSQKASTRADLFERRQVEFSQNLTKICDHFSSQMQTIRKDSFENCFQGLSLLIRQAATELNKLVQLETAGMDLRVDKNLGKDLYDILVHLTRNSIDHGIEDQFERAVNGKASAGLLKLEMSESNGIITMSFSDDGKGLNRDRILEQAIKKSLISEAEAATVSDSQIYQFIFEPSFSTKEKITTISGRGVGMDVVLTTIEKYQGKINIDTRAGQGTTFRIEIPVPQNIAIENILLCEWRNLKLAIPSIAIMHIQSCESLQITTVQGRRFCQYSQMTIPLMTYQEMREQKLDADSVNLTEQSVVFIKAKNQFVGLLVDRVDLQADLVVKAFSSLVGKIPGFKGLSVLADEGLAYIINPDEVLALISSPLEEAA